MDAAPFTFAQDTPISRVYHTFAGLNLVAIGIVSTSTNQYKGLITRRKLIEYTGAAHKMHEFEEAHKPFWVKMREFFTGDANAVPVTQQVSRGLARWRTSSVEFYQKGMRGARRSLGLDDRGSLRYDSTTPSSRAIQPTNGVLTPDVMTCRDLPLGRSVSPTPSNGSSGSSSARLAQHRPTVIEQFTRIATQGIQLQVPSEPNTPVPMEGGQGDFFSATPDSSPPTPTDRKRPRTYSSLRAESPVGGKLRPSTSMDDPELIPIAPMTGLDEPSPQQPGRVLRSSLTGSPQLPALDRAESPATNSEPSGSTGNSPV
jgi:hypothetical protein